MKVVLLSAVLAVACHLLTGCQSGPKVMKDCTAAQANLFICKEL